ncbi:MAG: protease family protein [Blastocatellia bacterium]
MSNHPDGPPKRFADSLIAIFINDEKELRSGWRVLLFFLAFTVAIIFIRGIAATLAKLIPTLRFLTSEPLPDAPAASRFRLLSLLITQAETLAAALIASFVCARWLERRTLSSVGFKLHRRWTRDFALGSLMGAAALALAVGLEAAAGAVHFTTQTTDEWILARNFGYLFLFFLMAGAFEELMFRGFPLQALIHNIGGWTAIGITSVFFGLAHIANANASVFSTINTILAGVWLGIAYLKTRSLWLATALHYSWNFVMVFVFGLNVSGIPAFEKLAWLHGESKPPLWISGGDYGPEAGAAATLALLLSTLLIWKSGWFRPTAEMLAAIKHGKPERPLSITTDETLRA